LRAPGSVFSIHATWLRDAEGAALEAALTTLRASLGRERTARDDA
jgi:hypothetical protein